MPACPIGRIDPLADDAFAVVRDDLGEQCFAVRGNGVDHLEAPRRRHLAPQDAAPGVKGKRPHVDAVGLEDVEDDEHGG